MRNKLRTLSAILLGQAVFAGLIFPSPAVALEVPVLKATINDFAGMMPQASYQELEERLRVFKTRGGHTIAVITVQSLENEEMAIFARKAFQNLPIDAASRANSVLLVVSLKDRKVGVEIGAELRDLFPEPETSQKLLSEVGLYFDGIRRDLGIHAGVNYIFKVIRREVRVGASTESEKLEDASKRGGGAGAILALFLAPFLAFFVGVLWGIYSTNYNIQRWLRIFMGAVFGGGTAKLVATFMAAVSSYGEGLWNFILAVSIVLGVFGSLTEFWMSGEWSGIPRTKDRTLTRKPTEKIGI